MGSPGQSVSSEQVNQSYDEFKSPKTSTLTDGLIETKLVRLDKTASKTMPDLAVRKMRHVRQLHAKIYTTGNDM